MISLTSEPRAVGAEMMKRVELGSSNANDGRESSDRLHFVDKSS